MKETNCNNPTCGKKLIHTEGRRPKKYCSPACRISHHLKQKKEPKYVQLETHNKTVKGLQEKLAEALSKATKEAKETPIGKKIMAEIIANPKPMVVRDIKPNGEVQGTCDLKTGKAIPPVDIEKQIAAIKAEKIPEHRNTPMGRKVWAADQQKRISELENK